MEEKYYTIGEMARLGLIKSRRGGAITNKSNLSVLLRGQNFTLKQTKHGLGKTLSESQIKDFNEKQELSKFLGKKKKEK